MRNIRSKSFLKRDKRRQEAGQGGKNCTTLHCSQGDIPHMGRNHPVYKRVWKFVVLVFLKGRQYTP